MNPDTSSLRWDLYRAFLAVMQHGSLTAAARALDSTQPTVGRHIEALEVLLGAPLFLRSPSGLSPNALAHDLLPHAEHMAAAADALLRHASDPAQDDKGTVRITASEVMGSEVLPPMLARFRRRHPLITLELELSNAPRDLLRHEADIAVRMFRPTQSALVASRIGQVQLALYAHRDYLQAWGRPRTLADVRNHHTLLGYDRERFALRASAAAGITLDRRAFSFRCDSDLALISALRAGIGIGACQVPIARRDPDLRPLFHRQFSIPLEVWLVMHESQRRTRRVTLLYEHLQQELGAYCASGD